MKIIDWNNGSRSEAAVLKELDRMNDEWCRSKTDALAMLYRLGDAYMIRVYTSVPDLEIPSEIDGKPIERIVRSVPWFGE